MSPRDVVFAAVNAGYLQPDPVVCAIIATECRFRSASQRVLEIAACAFLLFVLRRQPSLTIGMCQAGYAFWRTHYKYSHAALIAACSYRGSYRVCAAVLEGVGRDDLLALLARYNGRFTRHYASTFFRNLDDVLLAIEGLRLWQESRKWRVTPGGGKEGETA